MICIAKIVWFEPKLFRGSFDNSNNTNNGKKKGNTKTPKKTQKHDVQFAIEVMISNEEKKTFSVYQKDTSYEAAAKLVKNHKLDQELVHYFKLYIEEWRLKLNIKEQSHVDAFSPEHINAQSMRKPKDTPLCPMICLVPCSIFWKETLIQVLLGSAWHNFRRQQLIYKYCII